jgi:hypothetical protein
MLGRIIGVTCKDEFKNDQGRVFPATATFYVIRRNRTANSLGEKGEEIKLPYSHPVTQELLLGTQVFDHCLGAVLDYSFEVSQYAKIADIELKSYINSDGEVIEYNNGDNGPALWFTDKKQKVSA